MLRETAVLSLLLVGTTLLQQTQADVVTNLTVTKTDPTHITIPQLPQTTSHDVATECQYYQSAFTVNQAEWPTIWDIATSNNMNQSQEFQKLYNSIDWTKAPNIPVRKQSPTGGLDMTGYDTVQDPHCWWSASQCTKPKIQGVNGDIASCPEPETWGLTFDDGPNCSHNAFYDFLQQNNQKASMFYIGSNVINWPYGALRGVKDGHHIAGHTWSHKLMTTLTNQEVLAELYYTSKAIKYVTGITPLYWRPALGDLDDRVRWIASQLGLTAILWNLDTDDWAAGTTPGITQQTVNQNYENFITMGTNGSFVNSGNIVLSHEINNMTMDFAVQHYPAIKKAYKHVVDVATCMNISHPYSEKVITFPSFDAAVNKNASTATGSGVVPGASNSSDASQTRQLHGSLLIAAISCVAFLFLA
ncbi:chitin deacetylase 1 [Syncephalastrum racemosum]|uniref:chitin deacetylase n=1 Tax=Syncephalastrum racemosum TaxID=13706 RepID=A0A1X2HUZ0_SYNRA|nr:chitin deacetylase 1 [Syncephalastrum racemosum]